MLATLEVMSKKMRPVRLNQSSAERIRLIAEWMSDTDFFKNGEEVTMGDLIDRWTEPHIKKHIAAAIQHANEKNKGLMD